MIRACLDRRLKLLCRVRMHVASSSSYSLLFASEQEGGAA